MLVEIFDTNFWVEQIENRIAFYQEEQRKLDAEFEQKWRDSHRWRKPASDAKPPKDVFMYPTWIYADTIEKLKRLRNAFLTQNIGKIQLSETDISLIGAPIRGKRLPS